MWIDRGRDAARRGNPSDGSLGDHPGAPFGFSKRRTDQLLLQNVTRRLRGDAGSPRPHRLVEALAIPPFRIVAGEMKCQLGRTAHRLAEAVRTHEQPLAVQGTGFVKSRLLGIGAIVHKLALGETAFFLLQQPPLDLVEPARSKLLGHGKSLLSQVSEGRHCHLSVSVPQ
jgi:hypothetical protein